MNNNNDHDDKDNDDNNDVLKMPKDPTLACWALFCCNQFIHMN